MHSLRLKLIFTFLIISITGTLLTTMIVRLYNERAFNQLLQEQEHAELTSDLEAYYENNESWQGINRTLNDGLPLNRSNQPPARNEPQQGIPNHQPDPPLSFALIDENGRILVPNGRYMPGDSVPPDELADGIPLEVDGVQVGILLVEDRPPPRNPAQEAFAAQTNQALLIGALGGTAVAIILAIILARTLTRPLQELAAASREMAQGNLQQEVPVRTKDELGDLPHIFNRFYRGDSSRQEGQGESGLGLAIVKSLVEAMDGKISVESAGMNQGTSFTIIFPS